jgi:hypothetical protein
MLKEKTLFKHNEVHSRGINKKVGSMEEHYLCYFILKCRKRIKKASKVQEKKIRGRTGNRVSSDISCFTKINTTI